MRFSLIIAAALIGWISVANAQSRPVKSMSSGEILIGLEKLNVLGSVLYLAAHPDDENTRLISWLSNHRLARTAYLSLTRGDGGQNLIGTEKGGEMGLIRTQELLEARKIDKGEQFFTRAVDFGYSKNPDETFKIWNKEEVLKDVVWVIRKFRPDVIITRFPAQSTRGHGHHTASAILAGEAFKLAGDANAYPEQLKYVEPWSPKKLFLNASTWWDKELPEKAKGNPDYTVVNVGTYNRPMGISYTEMASASRSMHKSQGFGSTGTRGDKMEYLKILQGENTSGEVLGGIDVTWNRVDGGAKIGEAIEACIAAFNQRKPEKSVPALIEILKQIRKLKPDPWALQKEKEVKKLILACGGMRFDAKADKHTYAFGDSIKVKAIAINRSLDMGVKLKEVRLNDAILKPKEYLTVNAPQEHSLGSVCPSETTNPYWLKEDYMGLFKGVDQELVGKTQNDAIVNVEFTLDIDGFELKYTEPVVYQWNDRVDGELYRPISVVPPVSITPSQKIFMMTANDVGELAFTVKAHRDDTKAIINIDLPEGWFSEPADIEVDFDKAGEQQNYVFNLRTDGSEQTINAKLSALVDGKNYERGFVEIEYKHIQTQVYLPKSEAKVVFTPLKTGGKKIGYIMGAGDDIPDILVQLDFAVDLLEPASIASTDLSKYDAIVAGIRAYNTKKNLNHAQTKLMGYVEAGGTYIVQYNTNRGLIRDDLGPYAFTISRERVTQEDAKPTLMAEKHTVLNSPNKISMADFDGWVQERGLYFANEWSDEFTPVIGWNDTGEDSRKGGLLVAKHGKGMFVYTGISFFRQLPAGVPGAIKLFTNLLALKSTKS